MHRSGFQLGKDYVTAHGRRRYRLTRTSNPNLEINPSLWLVHYTASEVNYRYPTNQVPITPQVQQTLNARQYLMSRGQLVRKEFMLDDRNNWPHINVPGGQAPNSVAQQGNPYVRTSGAMPGRGIQQPPMYPPQQATRPVMTASPSKRPRMMGLNQIPSSVTSVPASTAYASQTISIEDEEDTAHGDSVDHVTQRELSTMRYKQHHTWMEEILSSPYTMNQIKPSELKLTPLIERVLGIKNATSSESAGLQVKLEELRKRTDERLAEIQAEMDKIRNNHAKMMQGSKGSLVIKAAEKELGDFNVERSDSGGEIWRIEKDMENRKQTDEIVKEVEAIFGKHIVTQRHVRLVQKGVPQEGSDEMESGQTGNQAEKPTTVGQVADTGISTNNDGGQMMEDDVGMNNDAGHLLDQYGMSSTTTPGASVQTPIGTQPGVSSSIENSTVFLPTQTQEYPQQPLNPDVNQPYVPTEASDSLDVDMTGVSNGPGPGPVLSGGTEVGEDRPVTLPGNDVFAAEGSAGTNMQPVFDPRGQSL